MRGMRPGLSLSELAELHRSGNAPILDDREPRHFLLLERREESAATATVALGSDPATPATPSLSLQARVFVLAFDRDDGVTLGRGSDADFEINDPAVSRAHLRFKCEAGTTSVSDENSHNGTTLNGSRITPGVMTVLRDGDVLEISEKYRVTFLGAKSLLARLNDAGTDALSVPTETASSGILAGKVAVITGGGRGLGRAYALRFAAEGCRVVVNDIGAPPYDPGTDVSVAARVVEEIERAGGTAIASVHDISRRDEVDALFALARERFGCVDILACSAGVLHAGSSVLEMDPEVWERLMQINARGTFLCVQAAARSMIEQGRPGRIITTSSMVAMNGNAGLGGYAASKAAIYALSQTAAIELAAHDITVNTLNPMAWTRLTEGIPAIAAIPDAAQVLSPNYVADVVLFLASELSAGITGQVIDVGGPQLSLYRMKQSVPAVPSGPRWTPEELRRRWEEISNA
ncbi:MAG: SDR family NAD(P)-dependent oxidoreductase [Myxococcota bacterium]